MNRKEFKELLTEWKQNFVNERVMPNIGKKLEDIDGSNVQSLSSLSLEKKNAKPTNINCRHK